MSERSASESSLPRKGRGRGLGRGAGVGRGRGVVLRRSSVESYRRPGHGTPAIPTVCEEFAAPSGSTNAYAEKETDTGVLSTHIVATGTAVKSVGMVSDTKEEVIDKQVSSIFLKLTSLSSLSSEKDIIVYFEAQGDNINVPSVKFFEKGRAIVRLDEVTQEERLLLFKKRHKINREQVEIKEISAETAIAALGGDVASCSALQVDNIPDEADEHAIKTYFESTESGGCHGIVEAVEFVDNKVVKVTFNNSQVAADIAAKKGHNLLGTELQVKLHSARPKSDQPKMMLDLPSHTLEVRNLPEKIDKNMLQLYFESVKSGGYSGAVRNVTFIEPGVAHVQLKNSPTAIEVMKRQHILLGGALQVTVAQDHSQTHEGDNILIVSGIPQSFSTEIIELYFENHKSGGCFDAVESISMFKPGAARVQFTSDTIASKVMAVKEHNLQGSVLQVQYLSDYKKGETTSRFLDDTLEISNLPADISEEYLQLYFENARSGGCADAVKNISLSAGVARIQFSTAKIAEAVAEKEHIIKGSTLKIQYCESSQQSSANVAVMDDTLQISNLPEHISKEYLQFYLESPKSGGSADGVKDIQIMSTGMAKVLFSSPKIAADILAKERHKIEGKELHLQYLKEIHAEEEVNINSTSDILQVSGIPAGVSTEFLEVYFQSERAGGHDECVKNIKIIEPGVANIQFTDAKTAADVFSRKKHKIRRTEVHVKYLPASLPVTYEMDKLILQDVPEEVDNDFLTLFVANCIKLPEDEFSVTRTQSWKKALVHFAKEYSLKELQVMIDRLQTKRMKQGSLSVVLYETCRSIKMHNVTEHYEEEYIVMYFETGKRSGGGAIESVQMLGEGEIVIIFKDPKVVPKVLDKTHLCFGSHVQLERNDPMSQHSESQEYSSSIDIVFDSVIVKCLSKHPEQLTELVKNLFIDFKFCATEGKIRCTSTKRTKAGWKEIAKRSIRSYVDSSYKTLPDQSIPKDAVQELYGYLSNLDDLEYVVSADGTVLKAGGEKKAIHSLEVTLKDIFDRYTVITASESFAKNPANFHFLVHSKLPELSSKFPQIEVTQEPQVPCLKLRGPKKDIARFQAMVPKLCNHSEVPVEVQPAIACYLEAAVGQAQLRDILKQNKTQAVPYRAPTRGLLLLCDSTHIDKVKKAAGNLTKVMASCERRIPSSFKVEQESYRKLCQSFENQHHVRINHSSNTVTVAGDKTGVDFAMTELYKFITDSVNRVECIVVERGEMRFLLSFMKEKWDTIKQKCKSANFTVQMTEPELTQDDEDNTSKLVLQGEQECVKDISDQISQLKATIFKQTRSLNVADINVLTSENGRTYLDGIEFRDRVVIEVALPESVIPKQNTLDSKYELKCTAKITEKTSIHIVIGDICDFNAADVIVNAANCDLKHMGGVAYAISKKGGSIIDEESARYIKSNGKLKTGDAWLTKKVGGLPCKALVHTVGPQWSGNYRRDAQLLESACMQALQKCSEGQGYRSIAFPAISTGVYRFPVDKCALCMINAMLNFCSSKPHNLESIYMIIHSSKSMDSTCFISALRQCLPASSISVNDGHVGDSQRYSVSTINATATSERSKPMKKKAKNVAASVSIPPGVVDCIKLKKGGILDVVADVLVNTTNNQLNLSSGAVSQALLKAGGPSLQDECNKKAPVKTGGMAVTSAGSIPCKYIFHIVIPSYDGAASEKILRSSINKCLKECVSRGVISIAIPSIGTGNLRFPNDVVAKITIDEVISFLSKKERGSLEFVHLAIFMEDCYKAFQSLLSKYGAQSVLPLNQEDHDDKPSVSGSISRNKRRRLVGNRSTTIPSAPLDMAEQQTFQIESLKVEIVSGDISDSTLDAIVNPTNRMLKLTGAGVAGAILAKGGQEQQNLCDTIIGLIQSLSDDKVVQTKATGSLRCKYIFHICHEDNDLKTLSKLVLNCLNKAEKMKLSSIAFPAIGAGMNSHMPRESAASLLQAIRTFASVSPLNIHHIQVVVCEPRILQAFLYTFQHPEEAQPSMLRQALNALGSIVGVSKNPSDPQVVPITQKACIRYTQLEVSVYGESEATVSRAHHKVECYIDEKLSNRQIDNAYIKSLPEADEENLRKLCNGLNVELDIDHDSCRINLKGNRIEVEKVHTAITESLYQYEKRLDKIEHATHLFELIRWKRKEPGSQEGEEYSKLTNYEIEMASRLGTMTCTIGTINDEEHFTIDFVNKQETDLFSGDVCEIERVDILKQLQSGSDKPPTWEDMPPKCPLHIVKLDCKSAEFTDIQQRFDQTMKSYYQKIVEIQRIQNPALYLQFIGRKKEMDRRNPPGHQNERQLFHGTAADSCPKINHNGFNRAFSGKNATVYGKGVYFARDASYSASNKYSPPDKKGYKYMYLVRALTGEFTTGSSAMIVPPPKDSTHAEYDSVVDNTANPGIFVIFYDALVYPDYLITFY